MFDPRTSTSTAEIQVPRLSKAHTFFSQTFKRNCKCLESALRYDVEVDHSQRSALRRIMERDDTPAKTLLLCVCGIVQTCQNPEKIMKDDKTPNAKMESCVIWLTDGWYSIKSLLDPPLSAMLNKARLKIGDKIVTSGAELVGSQEACPPLEAPESLMLKVKIEFSQDGLWDQDHTSLC